MKYPIILFLIAVLGSACKTAQQTNRISYGGSFGTQAEEKLEKSNSEVEKHVIPTQPKAQGEAKLAFPLQATRTILSEKYLKP